MAEGQISNATTTRRKTRQTDVLRKTNKAARAVSCGHVQVDVAMEVDGGLVTFEIADSLSEVGEVPLHSFDVDAHGGEVSLEGGCHSLQVSDVIAVATHCCNLCLESVELSANRGK